MKEKFNKLIAILKKLPAGLVGCLLLIVVSAVTLGIISINPSRAVPAIALTASFEGEYKIEDGEWQAIPQDGHISSTRGDVTLRGKFHVVLPD